MTTITDRADGGPITDAERMQLEDALTYFATAAPRHTADEEESLFPRMEASHNPDVAAVLNVIRHLESDHDEANRHHETVDRLVRRWLADGGLAASLAREVKQHLARLNRLYTAHITVEDREVFPAAARILSSNDIAAIGREMAARRSIHVLRPQAQDMTGVMVSPRPCCDDRDAT